MSEAALLAQIRAAAEAEVESRKRRGVWKGTVTAHVAYQTRPIEWIVEKLGVPESTLRWSLAPEYKNHTWDGDSDPIVKMLESLAAGKDTGIESATGTGKTFTAACTIMWFLACFENAIAETWAPKMDQLLLNIWKEIGRLWPRFSKLFPEAELLTGKIRMRPMDGTGKETWAATAKVAGVGADEEAATKAQGTHAEHLLIITEETPGIHPAIMTSLDHTRTADHNIHLALGNPDHRQDTLHRFCMRDAVTHIRISALDHPNIVTGRAIVAAAIGPRRLAERTAEYGLGSRLYQSRIRGISPAESTEALVKWDWCVAAAKRYDDPEFRLGVLGLGADVANSENGDKAAIARFQGRCCTEVVSMVCPDANVFGAMLAKEIKDPANPIDPRYVGVDPIGVGAGAVNELRRLGVKVRHLGGALRAVPGLDTDVLWSETTDVDGAIKPAGPTVVDAQRFNNLRSQVWWTLREDFRLGRIAIPYDEALFMDLTTPEWEPKNGVICVEKKEEIVKRLGRSPDRGDALCYGNFVRRRAPVHHRTVPGYENPKPNIDYGLEKMIAREQKRLKQRDADTLKSLRAAGRAMRAGRQ